jgi:ABC-type transport system involved in multi-copper enzyme maturation permease subunit
MTGAALRLVGLFVRLGAAFGVFAGMARLVFGQRIAALMALTWKAAFRFRLFLVITVLLLGAVIALPLLIKDDGTAQGFTQILITYTLSTVTGLLGLSTLWLSCGTLARDIEECQLQMLAVKPVARWQIWLGKWLGIMSLNAALLAISGVGIYALLQTRANKLPPAQQAVLRNEILVARGSARPEGNVEKEIDRETDRILRERLAVTPVARGDVLEVRKQIREQLKAEYQVVPPGYQRVWNIDLGLAKNSLRDRPLQLRIKFNSADKSPSGTFDGIWLVGVPQKTQLWRSDLMSLAPDTFHEIRIPPNLFDENGVLTVTFANANDTALLFPLDEGMEVLYPQGKFGLNFARGLGIIFCWMGLLAAIGLASASFLSFPVAAFFALGLLTMVFSSGTISTAVSDGTIMGWNSETGKSGHSVADTVVIPMFRAALKVINLAKQFSPIDALSTGRSISWSDLAVAFGEIVLLLGGVAGISGMIILTRRELATAQGTQ